MKPKDLFIPLVLLNICAVAAGAYYYYDQLAATPAHLLLFVPDCPLYVLLFLPILLGLVRDDRFSFLVSVGMAKYGLWTSFVLVFHWGFYSQPAFLLTTVVFIAGHLGMALEGLAILPEKRIGALALIAITCWFLLNDFADYSLGTVPPIPRAGMALVAALTILSSIALPLLFYFAGGRARNLLPARLLREMMARTAR